MKRVILLTAIVAVTCMFTGCEQNTNEPELLKGLFSVSATKQVMFAPGNLQYTQSTQTWSFAAEQYKFIGIANVTNCYGLADKIDLFGWSGNTGEAKWGVSTSASIYAYSGDFLDWGKDFGDGMTWRTLTKDEWGYLLGARTNAASLKGIARILLGKDEYANGLILLPDNWEAPAGVTFKSGFSREWGVQAYADYQTFTLVEWRKLEAAGAVFLPASGIRGGSDVYGVQDYGNYWSATSYDYDDHVYCAHPLLFDSRAMGIFEKYRCYGYAVRLVQDITD